MKRSDRQIMLELLSVHNNMNSEYSLRATPESEREYKRSVKCGRRHCSSPSAEWSEAPRPFEMSVTGQNPACLALPYGTCGLMPLIRERLKDVIVGNLPGAVWGRCQHDTDRFTKDGRWYTMQVPRRMKVDSHRHSDCHHYQCAVCMKVVSFGKPGLVREQLEGRDMVCDDAGIYLSPELWEKLRLQQLMPDLKVLPITVLEKPRDGWILPGDPDWDGILRTPWEWMEYIRSTIGPHDQGGPIILKV